MINCKDCFHYKVCRYVRYEEFKSCKHYTEKRLEADNKELREVTMKRIDEMIVKYKWYQNKQKKYDDMFWSLQMIIDDFEELKAITEKQNITEIPDKWIAR